LLGKGGGGSVREGEDLVSKEKVAIKVIEKEKLIKDEIDVAKKIKPYCCRQIVQIFECFI
jgi:serine/threonine protein kinase